MPDPTAIETFETSTLVWADQTREPHASILSETRHLLAVRREVVIPLMASGFLDSSFTRHGSGGLEVEWRFNDGTLRLIANFEKAALAMSMASSDRVVWRSEHAKIGDQPELPAWTGIITVRESESETE